MVGLIRLAVIVLFAVLVVAVVRRLIGMRVKGPRPDRDLLLSEAPVPGASPDTAHEFRSHAASHKVAKAERCRSCEGSLAVQDHFDEAITGRYYHIVSVICRKCGARDRVYFRLGTND